MVRVPLLGHRRARLPPPLPLPRLLLLRRLGPGVHLGRHVLHGRGLGTRARSAHLQPVVAVLLPTEGLQHLARERERLRVSGQDAWPSSSPSPSPNPQPEHLVRAALVEHRGPAVARREGLSYAHLVGVLPRLLAHRLPRVGPSRKILRVPRVLQSDPRLRLVQLPLFLDDDLRRGGAVGAE